MRRFYLYRTEDETGISGTGIVAEGVELKSGQVVLSWLTEHTSTAIYGSLKELEKIHGHGGKTQIVTVDARHPDPSYYGERFKRIGR